jgi:hypothetical protein
MRLGDGEACVDISASREKYEGGTGGPDIFVAVEVRIGDFSAAIGTVVARGDWQAFRTALSQLEEQRRGEAVLESADGRELRLRVHAADRVGHMAISGEIERRDLPSEPRLIFGKVQFDPTLLSQLVAEVAAVVA